MDSGVTLASQVTSGSSDECHDSNSGLSESGTVTPNVKRSVPKLTSEAML